MILSPIVFGLLLGAATGGSTISVLSWLEARRLRQVLYDVQRGQCEATRRIGQAIREFERTNKVPSDPLQRVTRYELHIDVRRVGDEDGPYRSGSC